MEQFKFIEKLSKITPPKLFCFLIKLERDIMTPSIDVIVKVADALNVSIDYLVGKTTLELDHNVLKRVEEIFVRKPKK